MSWGGARIGAGRHKKPLADKIAEGNPGKRELKTVQFPKSSNQVDKQLSKNQDLQVRLGPPDLLALNGLEGGDNIPSATEIFALLTAFIKSSGCEHLIAVNLVEDFAHFRRSYLECEYMNRTRGRIANGKRSPYVTMAVDYNKQALAIYDRIWNIIAQNSEQSYEGKNEFLSMLTNRGF
jgi:hypothetical protein